MSLLDLPTPPAWMRDALCAQVDPELFFPEQGGANITAKGICARCPVFDECKQYALAHDEHGVWAGMSEHTRLVIQGRSAS